MPTLSKFQQIQVFLFAILLSFSLTLVGYFEEHGLFWLNKLSLINLRGYEVAKSNMQTFSESLFKFKKNSNGTH